MPPLDGLLETALYVDSPERSAEFYRRLFGFEIISRSDRLIAMNVLDRHVLLLFRKGAPTEPLPPHNGSGQLHLAFSITVEALPKWEAWLNQEGVGIEARKRWDRGGESLYFRDPDGHLLELATPGVWTIY